MPAVSVIIPTHDRARFVTGAIDSALAQGEGVEVIVVDDGSTDGTAAILNGYGDRIVVIRQANHGPGAARNAGAEQARGEYLFFLDSDDLLEPGAKQALLAEARRLGPDQVPFGRASTINAEGGPAAGPSYGYGQVRSGHQLKLAELLGNVMPLCLCLLPRRSFHALGGLRTDLKLGEDHEFAVRLHQSGLRYVATGVPVISVRLHGDPRLSSTKKPDFGRQAVLLWSSITNLARGSDEFDGSAKAALAKAIWISGRDTARAGEQLAAEELFARAKSLDAAVEQVSPWPLRVVSKVAGPFRAERCAERVKSVLRRG